MKGCWRILPGGLRDETARGGASMAIPEIYTVAHLFLDNTEDLPGTRRDDSARSGEEARQQLFQRHLRGELPRF